MGIPSDIEAFLRAHGAEGIPHPGGTLYAHLARVGATLQSWDAPEAWWTAGLCHATYGTAGFPYPLLDLARRPVLAGLIGPDAERLVYLYGSCDRAVVYPRLEAEGEDLVFRDRFTGAARLIDVADLRAFAELTVANELDVLAQNTKIAASDGVALDRLLTACARWLSPGARRAVEETR